MEQAELLKNLVITLEKLSVPYLLNRAYLADWVARLGLQGEWALIEERLVL